MNAGFRKLGERSIHQGHVIGVATAEFEAPDGSRFERDVVHHPGAVAVVALHADYTVTMVRQFRAPLDGVLLELPAGKRDVAGESPEITAQRELGEEVGLRPGRMELLAAFHNSPGFSDELALVFLATELTEVGVRRDGIEEQSMTIERIALGDVPALIASQELRDAKSIIGLLMTRERLGLR